MGRRLADAHRVALDLGNLANIALLEQDYARAVELGEESLALRRRQGSTTDIALALADLAQALYLQGNYHRAETLLRESLSGLRDTRYMPAAADCLELLAKVLYTHGNAQQACRLLGAATTLRSTFGTSRLAQVQADYESTVAAVREALGEEAVAAAWADGAVLGLDEAIACAVDGAI